MICKNKQSGQVIERKKLFEMYLQIYQTTDPIFPGAFRGGGGGKKLRSFLHTQKRGLVLPQDIHKLIDAHTHTQIYTHTHTHILTNTHTHKHMQEFRIKF